MRWYLRFTAWSSRHRFGVDLAGTLAWSAFVLLLAAASDVYQTDVWERVLWSAAMLAPMPWRRTRPVASAVAVYGLGFAHVLCGIYLLFPTDVVVLVSLYSITVYGPRWAHKVAIGSSLAGALLSSYLEVSSNQYPGTSPVTGVVVAAGFMASVFLAVWAFGLTRRARLETLQALRDRAERLEVERDQQTQIAAADERARIAREMHDIVAHSLSVIIAQADGGRYAATSNPEAATTALSTVAETGRAALADMRRLLGVLRSDDAADDQKALLPQPDTTDIEQLVDDARASGMRVSFIRSGTPRALPPGAGLTVYRVCQESLTNVLKHAGADPSVSLALHWLPEALEVEVTDNGLGTASANDSPGFGLVGMNERAALFGGTVTAGPRPGGGFRVRFHMPLPRA